MKKLLVLLLGISCSAMAMEQQCICIKIQHQRPAAIGVQEWLEIGKLLEDGKLLVPEAVHRVLGRHEQVNSTMIIFVKNAREITFQFQKPQVTTTEEIHTLQLACLIKRGEEKTAKKLFSKPFKKNVSMLDHEVDDTEIINKLFLVQQLCEGQLS